MPLLPAKPIPESSSCVDLPGESGARRAVFTERAPLRSPCVGAFTKQINKALVLSFPSGLLAALGCES